MPQVCKVCMHPLRRRIDAELTGDWERGLRAIGAEYGLSKDSVARHASNHLPDLVNQSFSNASETLHVNCAEKEPSATLELIKQKKAETDFKTEKNGDTATVLKQEKTEWDWESRFPPQPESSSMYQESPLEQMADNPWRNWEKK